MAVDRSASIDSYTAAAFARVVGPCNWPAVPIVCWVVVAAMEVVATAAVGKAAVPTACLAVVVAMVARIRKALAGANSALTVDTAFLFLQ